MTMKNALTIVNITLLILGLLILVSTTNKEYQMLAIGLISPTLLNFFIIVLDDYKL
jgi:hypothetical protein